MVVQPLSSVVLRIHNLRDEVHLVVSDNTSVRIVHVALHPIVHVQACLPMLGPCLCRVFWGQNWAEPRPWHTLLTLQYTSGTEAVLNNALLQVYSALTVALLFLQPY